MARGFCGKKRLEDAVLKIFGDIGTVIPDFDKNHIRLLLADDAEAALLIRVAGAVNEGEGFEGIFDERGPDLVQLAAVGVDGRQFCLIFTDNIDLCHARLKHLQGGVEAGWDIDLEDGCAVHVGVGLDGADEVKDAVGGVEHGLGVELGAEGGGELLEDDVDCRLIEELDERVKVSGFDAEVGELGSDLPGPLESVAFDPLSDFVFAGDDIDRILLEVFVGFGADLPFPCLDSADLILGEAEADESVAAFVDGAQLGKDATCGSLGGRGRVIELVGEVGGELAQCAEFFALLLDAGNFANAVEEGGDDALAEGGDGGQHLRKYGFVKDEAPTLLCGESLASVTGHARVGEQAGHLAAAADEEGHGAGARTADVELALED